MAWLPPGSGRQDFRAAEREAEGKNQIWENLFCPRIRILFSPLYKKCPSTVLQQYITHLGQNIVTSSTSDKMTTGGSDMVRDPRES